MGIFGELDATTIPSNPFWVEKGEYECEITGAEIKHDPNRDQWSIQITHKITDEASEFVDKDLRQYLRIPDPKLTKEDVERLSPEAKKTLRQDNANTKRALCGDTRVKGLGVPAEDLNDPDWSPRVLLGLRTLVVVDNYGDDNEKFTVKYSNLLD